MKYLAIALLLATSAVSADDYQVAIELAKQKHLINQSLEMAYRATQPQSRNVVSSTCFTGALPTIPRSPSYTGTWSYPYDNELLTLTLWREPCKNGTGNALLVRAIPTKGNPFFCSPLIVQNGVQNNEIKLQQTATSYGWCDELYAPTTLIVSEYPFGQVPFNVNQALTFIYDRAGVKTTINIPALTTLAPVLNGVANGYKSATVTCVNNTTNKSVTTAIDAYGVWDCKAKGLIIKANDTVTTYIKGIIK